jgi:hypothetical protein
MNGKTIFGRKAKTENCGWYTSYREIPDEHIIPTMRDTMFGGHLDSLLRILVP